MWGVCACNKLLRPMTVNESPAPAGPNPNGGQPSPDPWGILGLDDRRHVWGNPSPASKIKTLAAVVIPLLLFSYPSQPPSPQEDLGAGRGRLLN